MNWKKNLARWGTVFSWIGLSACALRPEAAFYGAWRELMPANPWIVQGLELAKDGKASSFGMATLQYNAWKLDDNRLILQGTSLGNGQTIPFADTLEVVASGGDTLILGKGEAYRITYVRQPTDLPTITLPALSGEDSVRLHFGSDSSTVQLWFSAERAYALSLLDPSEQPDGRKVWSWAGDEAYRLERQHDEWIVSRWGKRLYASSVDESDRPSRPAYAGFHWEYLSGNGLGCWAQRNDSMRLMIDPDVPGVVVVRDGEATPRVVVRMFDLPDGRIESLYARLSREPGWHPDEPGRFQERSCDRPGVRRFVLVPDGAYARRVAEWMSREPVPSTCSGWGIGNSGMRYFEIQEAHPDKAIFVEIGQDAPLFDEESFRFEDTPDGPDSRDVLRLETGLLRIGHEVRSFTPDGGTAEYWFVDKTGRLEEAYEAWTRGNQSGKAVKARLKVEYNGKWDDGFAADYDGVYWVREIIGLEPLP